MQADTEYPRERAGGLQGLPKQQSALGPMLPKLQLWKKLSMEEQESLLALPHRVETVRAGHYVVKEGDKTQHSCLLLSGFACRQKLARDGGRSISALHLKGDLVDLQNSLLGVADHSVQALTEARIARIPREAVTALAFRFPNIGFAMWYDTLVDGSIFREWILNIARRDAQTRIAHVICEFGVRLESLGMGDRFSYEFPMTQDQLADTTGLTNVHVNRCLRDLTERGLITRTMRYVAVADWEALSKEGDFDQAYLHLPKAKR